MAKFSAPDKSEEKPKDHLDEQLDPQGTPHNELPTLSEIDVDMKQVEKVNATEDALAAAKTGLGDNVEVIYSSHPVKNFSVGPFQFERGILKFTGDESEGRTADDFESLLAQMPAVERLNIRKVDQGLAEEMVRNHQLVGGATKNFDSSVGRQALQQLHAESPLVGTEDVAHALLPQQDNNRPVVPTEPVDPEGKTGLDQGAHIAPDAEKPAK